MYHQLTRSCGLLLLAGLLTALTGFAQADNPPYMHDHTAPIDGDIVADFGLDPFYERFWGTLTVIDDNRVRRDDGGIFDASYVGRVLCLKFADQQRVPGMDSAGYYTITAVIDEQTIELDQAPCVAVGNEAGYIFGDNEAGFQALLDTALSSGRVYKVSVPGGATFVLHGPFTINNTEGGVHFVSEPTDDPYVGGAVFKLMREEDSTPWQAWFAWREVGLFDVVFENINLVARDNYSFATEDNQSWFALKTPAQQAGSFTLKIMHSDSGYEYRKFGQQVRDYLAARFGDGADIDELQRLYYLCARPRLLRTQALGRQAGGRPFTWHLEHVDAWYIRFYEVSNTLFNKSPLQGICIMRHVRMYGFLDHGRNGIEAGSSNHPLVNITADADGDYTIMRIAPESPYRLDFPSLKSLYSNFSRKRPGHGFRVQIEGVTQRGDDVPSGQRRDFIFINQAKNRGGSAALLGQVLSVVDRGEGVYDLIIARAPQTVNREIGTAAGSGERLDGVTQYDYIASDRNGALTLNHTGDEPEAMINRATGYPNDYRGWVRFVYGDGANDLYFDGGADWASMLRAPRVAATRWVWLDNEEAATQLKAGDKVFVPSASHSGMMAVVQADGRSLHYLGTSASPEGNRPAFGWGQRLLEIDGHFYSFEVDGGYVRNLDPREGEEPSPLEGRSFNRYSEYVWGFRHGFRLILPEGQKIEPGRYPETRLWHEAEVVEVVAEQGTGTRLRLSGAEGVILAGGDQVRPAHPGEPAVGTMHYAISVRTGNRAQYPSGQPFVPGEMLYAYYLGTGADHAAPAVRLRPQEVILPKEWAVPGPVRNARLKVFTDPAAGSGTHWVYGKHHGYQYLWEDVTFVDGKLSLIIRDGGSTPEGSVLLNSTLDHGSGLQLGGPLTVDGGWYKVYGGSGDMTVRNHPTLSGALRGFNIIDGDGKGWVQGK